MGFLLRTVITAVAFWAASRLVPGIQIPGIFGTLMAAIVFGLVNAVVRPVLATLSLPLTFITLGLFTLVVNAAMFGLTALLIPGMRVQGFVPAILGAIVVAVVSWAANKLIGDRNETVATR